MIKLRIHEKNELEFYTYLETEGMYLLFYPYGDKKELYCDIHIFPKLSLPNGIAYSGCVWPFLIILRNHNNTDGVERLLAIKLSNWAIEAVAESNFRYALQWPEVDLIYATKNTDNLPFNHVILRVDKLSGRYEVWYRQGKDGKPEEIAPTGFGIMNLTNWVVLNSEFHLVDGRIPIDLQDLNCVNPAKSNMLIKYEMLGNEFQSKISSFLTSN